MEDTNRSAGTGMARTEPSGGTGRGEDPHARLAAIAEAARVVLWEVRLPEFEFTEISPVAEAVFGYPVARWSEPGFWESLIHPDDREAAVAFCMAQSGAGHDHAFEYRAIRADGEVIRIRDVVTLVREGRHGGPILRGAMMDVTSGRFALDGDAEAALSEAAARATAFAQTAHDLRTALSAIGGALTVLRGDPAARRLGSCLDLIETASGTMLELIEAGVERPDAARSLPAVNCCDVALAPLLLSTVELVRPLAEERGHGIDVDLDPALPAIAHLDPILVKRVALNLLGSAAKLPQAGRIGLAASLSGRHLRLVVSETAQRPEGETAGTEARALVLSGGETDAAATGRLGLRIAGQSLAAMGGTIAFESEPGGARRTIVDIPLGMRPECSRRNAGRRVLYAEDDPTNARVLREMLALDGVETEVVTSGEQALERLRTERFDLVFMDLHLPGMGGIETTRRICGPTVGALALAARPPIVGLTADTRPSVERECLEAGMQAMLVKPLRMNKLMVLLERFAPEATDPAA